MDALNAHFQEDCQELVRGHFGPNESFLSAENPASDAPQAAEDTTSLSASLLDHQNEKVASQIWRLFQSAYEIEAQLLGLQDFPPLNRPVKQIRQAETAFFGSWYEFALVAVIELEGVGTDWIHINSLGVAPTHFRQGFGTQLLNEVLELHPLQRFTVATAVANIPALHLYKNAGFYQQKHWTTPDHIHMVTLEKS
jgi:ribosomal protein S18 acetylase RimI-like enzyme